MNAKRGSLFASKPIEHDNVQASLQASETTSLQPVAPARQSYPKASTRQGKKAITVYVEPEVLKQLRRLREADEDEGKEASIQDLMVEAINALFAQRGVSRLA